MRRAALSAAVVFVSAAMTVHVRAEPSVVADAGAPDGGAVTAGTRSDGAAIDQPLVDAGAADLAPAVVAPSPIDPAIAARLSRLEELERTQERSRSAQLKSAKRARTSAIVLTGLGVAAQIAGAIDLGGGLGTTHPAYEAFIAVGSHPFIDSIVGVSLSIIGAVMWPVGTARWVESQKQINELSHEGVK